MLLTSFHSSSSLPKQNPKIHQPFKDYHFLNLFLTIVLVAVSCFVHTCHASCNQLHRDSLSSFNLSLSASPPLNWSLLHDCCSWEGVGCDGSGRVTNLWLPSRGLVGSISPSIVNLTSLSQLSLSHNWLSGPLPDDFFVSLNQLQVIDLSRNRLSGELAPSEKLPATVQIFNLSNNHFHGPVQSSFLQPALNLETFDVSNNSFSGSIPTSICSFSPLIQWIDLSNNDFTGPIAQGFGKCTNLQSLRVGFTNLSGEVPQDIYELLTLQELYLPGNKLSGAIDERIVNLSNLRILALYANELTGTIPQDIGRLSKLEQLLIHINQLSGTIPPSLTNCTRLTALNLRVNYLEGELSAFDFSKFVQLNLNNMTSAIRILTGCKNLSTLILSKNFYDEALPGNEDLVGVEMFQNLQVLGLGGCRFTGQIPQWLSELNKLEVLDLSYNNMTGPVPGWFGTLPNLFYLDLSHNLLTGYFPMELIKLRRLASQQISDQVDRSNLELPVFVQPNNASNLQYSQLANLPPALYLGSNSIGGTIPIEIVLRTTTIEGPIPTGGQFDTFPASSFEGNPRLCGRILQRSCTNQSGNTSQSATRKGDRKKTIILTLVICSGVFSMTLLLYLVFSKRRNLSKGDQEKDLDTISFNSSGVFPEVAKDTSLVILFPNNKNKTEDLTIADILKATDNFNQSNIIGCGGFGLVYKATLTDGTKLAIKKLSGDMGLMEREFKAEVEALSTAQHKNLVALQGYCVHDGFRLLIYSYMENGSLDYWLHEKPDGASQLSWPVRLRIAQGASCGVAYMHQICEPHIVHRDLKSSNILLDQNFEAHVADFGLARLILPYHTHVTTELVGTLGYIPPEYSQSWIATLRGDVYSFGVVMLELLTGKRPVELFKPKMSRELVIWVQQMRSEGKQDEIFDPLLRGKGFEEEMLQVLDVACMCVNQNPFKRPTIKEVVDWLKDVGSNRQTTT
ncbi:UNVERIFIED_CONTAM: Tyrosine-sulfated glycopeptide receptor 1 [Sesamum calycinum]|uniref:non-specific serine/threonine protein kinase n=1 Tax=Sesamum calycinum TaxID=2727403 RepID=A0AAW2ND68_9LAMI